ncbi:MAG TPA: Maf family protein [Candidatus Omnitrophota bacterium]|nr:Maf family protein [Candidatus Omnitrophota bacterium]
MSANIILASASPRRKDLLAKFLRKFDVIPSVIDESRIFASDPETFARKAAIFKANDVAASHKDAIVIGADTIVVLDGKILGKPKDAAHAVSMLKALSGRTHQVITGLAVVFPNQKDIVSEIEVTRVKMKRTAEKDILDYVKSGRPMDKAGAYGIQEIEGIFIDNIEGDRDNVVGLPVARLKSLLSRHAKGGC